MKVRNIVQHPEVDQLIACALAEDLGPERVDVTSVSVVPEQDRIEARMIAREPCRIAGLPVAIEVFNRIDSSLECEALVNDGDAVEAMTPVLIVRGSARSILTAERTALNFAQRMSGVATVTAEYVAAANAPDVSVLDTRKTTPGHRALEKYAVARGGGVNHRIGLYDAVMIKDNHLAAWKKHRGMGVNEAVEEARRVYPDLKIQLEVDTVDQLKEALPSKPDWVLLDNMPPAVLRECVALCDGVCKTEASGGVNLRTIGEIAKTGVDAISVGALTHSAPSIDLALDFVE